MDFAHFHFIRPYWLLAIVVLFIVMYLLKKYRVKQSGWQHIIPAHLAKVLIENPNKNKKLSLILPFIIGLLAILAMAGPTWKKLPQPVYQVARGSVVIMDLSYSMFATDLSPNRITRARYKAIDLLDQLNEGEIGLIAYAGDAFVISPLTEDFKNIHLLLPALSPDIMPELGSNPLSALYLAEEMLKNAGHINGDIYWFTDGIENDEISEINAWSQKNNYTLNILGIGTENGAPIKLSSGELMKDNTGAIIVPNLNNSPLLQVAKKNQGKYISITQNNDDIEALVTSSLSFEQKENDENARKSQNIGDQWQDMGAYLIFALLPLVLFYFRRGVFLALFPIILLLTPSEEVYANTWDDLWKTQNQQAQEKFNDKSYQAAAEKFTDPLWQGSAYYKAGEYEKALEAFKQVDSAQSLYNQGNTLAKLNKLDEAIKAYDNALNKEPNLIDAQANKDILEQLKEQQKQNQSESDSSEDNNQEQSDSEENESQNQNLENQDSEDNNSDNQSSQNSDESQSADENSQDNDPEQSSGSEQDPSESEKQSDQEQNKSDDEKPENEQEQTAEKAEGNKNDEPSEQEQQSLAQGEESDKLAQETSEKHQQILNKVTDDPYLLLRNKMRLEYQKRKQNRSPSGVQKQW